MSLEHRPWGSLSRPEQKQLLRMDPIYLSLTRKLRFQPSTTGRLQIRVALRQRRHQIITSPDPKAVVEEELAKAAEEMQTTTELMWDLREEMIRGNN